MKSLKPVEVQPIHLFVIGGADTGKSHLFHTIYHTTKSFRRVTNNPEQPTVLLVAPTRL